MPSQLEQCPSEPAPADCEFDIARTYFDANRFELAGPIFRRLAMDPQAGDAGTYAAQILLECLNVLGSRSDPPRPSCYEQMADDVPRLLSIHCGAGPRPKPDELCPLLHRITVDLARLSAEKSVRQADSEEVPMSLPLYRRAGEAYMAVFGEYCRLDARGRNARGEVPDTGFRCDELLYNAYRAFRAAGEREQAQAARAAMLDPKNKLERSPLARRLAADEQK